MATTSTMKAYWSVKSSAHRRHIGRTGLSECEYEDRTVSHGLDRVMNIVMADLKVGSAELKGISQKNSTALSKIGGTPAATMESLYEGVSKDYEGWQKGTVPKLEADYAKKLCVEVNERLSVSSSGSNGYTGLGDVMRWLAESINSANKHLSFKGFAKTADLKGQRDARGELGKIAKLAAKLSTRRTSQTGRLGEFQAEEYEEKLIDYIKTLFEDSWTARMTNEIKTLREMRVTLEFANYVDSLQAQNLPIDKIRELASNWHNTLGNENMPRYISSWNDSTLPVRGTKAAENRKPLPQSTTEGATGPAPSESGGSKSGTATGTGTATTPAMQSFREQIQNLPEPVKAALGRGTWTPEQLHIVTEKGVEPEAYRKVLTLENQLGWANGELRSAEAAHNEAKRLFDVAEKGLTGKDTGLLAKVDSLLKEEASRRDFLENLRVNIEGVRLKSKAVHERKEALNALNVRLTEKKNELGTASYNIESGTTTYTGLLKKQNEVNQELEELRTTWKTLSEEAATALAEWEKAQKNGDKPDVVLQKESAYKDKVRRQDEVRVTEITAKEAELRDIEQKVRNLNAEIKGLVSEVFNADKEITRLAKEIDNLVSQSSMEKGENELKEKLKVAKSDEEKAELNKKIEAAAELRKSMSQELTKAMTAIELEATYEEKKRLAANLETEIKKLDEDLKRMKNKLFGPGNASGAGSQTLELSETRALDEKVALLRTETLKQFRDEVAKAKNAMESSDTVTVIVQRAQAALDETRKKLQVARDAAEAQRREVARLNENVTKANATFTEAKTYQDGLLRKLAELRASATGTVSSAPASTAIATAPALAPVPAAPETAPAATPEVKPVPPRTEPKPQIEPQFGGMIIGNVTPPPQADNKQGEGRARRGAQKIANGEISASEAATGLWEKAKGLVNRGAAAQPPTGTTRKQRREQRKAAKLARREIEVPTTAPPAPEVGGHPVNAPQTPNAQMPATPQITPFVLGPAPPAPEQTPNNEPGSYLP